MNKEILDFTINATQELIHAHSCCIELKTAAENWLAAIGTDNEATEAQKYIAELEEDIATIDSLISFAESDAGAQVFGADTAKNIAAHAKEIKAAGAIYCDCPACSAAAKILEKKEDLLK